MPQQSGTERIELPLTIATLSLCVLKNVLNLSSDLGDKLHFS